MKKLICGLGLALGLSLSCHAQGMKISAYPNTNNLAGTNLFLIAIVGSPGTNMNISYAQLSNLLAAAIGGGGGGAQVWTNDGSFIKVVDTNTPIRLISNQTNSALGMFSLGYSVQDDSADEPLGLVVSLDKPASVTPTNVQVAISIWGSITVPCSSAAALYFTEGADGVAGSAGSTANSLTNASVAVIGNAFGNDGLLCGVCGCASPNSANQTNIGVVGTTTSFGAVGVFTGGYFENLNNGQWDGSDDPFMETAVLVCDNRDTGNLLQLWRTNNGVHVASMDMQGMLTLAGGTFYASNAAPVFPTAAALGAGGFWDGNSNGFKVTIWSDGAATTMKVWGPPF